VNARTHNPANLAAIEASLKRFGQVTPLVANSRNNQVVVGNGRFTVASGRLAWSHVAVVWKYLTESQQRALSIADNRTAELAEWDADRLALELSLTEADDSELYADLLLADLQENVARECPGDETYTDKITSPIYEPKGGRPPISSLTDRQKTSELLAGIDAVDLPAEVKEFLRYAAERHTIFNFRQIAEYYCHADAKLQDLMERSGLVIIDFHKAIEYGFVHLTERLGQLVDLEEADDGDA